MDLWQSSLQEFRDGLASSAPAPGGGAAGAVACTLGAALLIMACEIAAQRENAPPEIAAALPGLRKAMAGLSVAAEKDAEAYGKYAAANALPKNSEAESAARGAALQAALTAAAASPASAAAEALSALETAEKILPLIHAGIVSDVAAGAELLNGGVQALLFTLDSNIRLMKDAARRSEYLDLRRSLAERTDAILPRIRQSAAAKLAP